MPPNHTRPRVVVELDPTLDPQVWAARHEAGEVPDLSPYGLDRLGAHGFDVRVRRPLVEGRRKRLADRTRGRVGGFGVLEATLSGRSNGHPDVVLAWDERTGLPAIARETLLRHGAPVATGLIWLTDPAAGSPAARRAAALLLPRAGLVWTLAGPQVTAAIRLGARPDRVRFLPFGIDTDFFSEAAAARDPDLVLSAGNDRHRDHALLVSALGTVARNRPGTKLLLATRQPVELPAELGVRKPAIAHPAMRAAHQRAAVVAVATRPNDHASGVTVVLEAMSTGAAVVCSATEGMSDYVEHGVTGLLVPPGDPQRLAAAVEQLLREPERAKALGTRAAEVTRRDFSTMAMTGRLAELMGRML